MIAGWDEIVAIEKEKDYVEITEARIKYWRGHSLGDEKSYQSIFSKLERWYGVRITVIGNLPADRQYKGRFKNEILVNILESIRYGHDFDFKIDGKNIEIMFN